MFLIQKESSSNQIENCVTALANGDIINHLNATYPGGPDFFTSCQKFFNYINDPDCSVPFIASRSSAGHFSSLGQKYHIDWPKSIEFVVYEHCLQHIAKVYGNTGVIISELLKENGPLTQVEAEKMCLAESKEFRETIFRMIQDNVMSLMVIFSIWEDGF